MTRYVRDLRGDNMRKSYVMIGMVLMLLAVGWYISLLLLPFLGESALCIAGGLCLFSPVLFLAGLLLFIVGLVADEKR